MGLNSVSRGLRSAPPRDRAPRGREPSASPVPGSFLAGGTSDRLQNPAGARTSSEHTQQPSPEEDV